MEFEFANITQEIFQRVDLIWTFILLAVRFTGLLLMMPGIGMGDKGINVRKAGILIFAYAAMIAGQPAVLPPHWIDAMLQAFSELMLGVAIGIIPAMMIAGIQTAGTLSSTTMGLGAAQLLDPTLGINVTSLSRVFGDTVIVLFLLMGGHHILIHTVAGLGGQIVPGTFFINEPTLAVLIDRSAHIFHVGVMVSAPVIVALLLTQFVMGLVTKAVPTVNIFIVSFPLTIGIGLVLSALSLPEIVVFVQHDIIGLENAALTIVQGAKLVVP